ncbi:hypothetical protein [Bradyrhizobium sp. USDA 4486]
MIEEFGKHPTASPPSFNIQFNRSWTVLRPRLYRFLEAQYVEAFFKDGSLRLSSFSQFAKHPDEQRQDAQEGTGIRFGLGKNLTMVTVQGRGSDCYVLCGTLNNTAEMRKLFPQYDACLVIDDITAFANTVSTKIPFVGGLEGIAIYQDEPTITKSVGLTAEALLDKYRVPDGNISMDMLRDTMNTVGGPEEYFIKHSRYSAQCEYKLLWATGQPVSPFIDIKVPEAIQFCRRLSLNVTTKTEARPSGGCLGI